MVRKNIFCTRPTRPTKEGQKSFVTAKRAPQTNQAMTLFHMHSFSSHLPQFHSQCVCVITVTSSRLVGLKRRQKNKTYEILRLSF
jgi:hypothetical protein